MGYGKLNKVILAPDSFKGTLTARQVCEIESRVIRSRFPRAQVCAVPMADGGEGMAEAYLAVLGGRRRTVQVCGPLGRPVEAAYAVLPDGSAVIEMAAAAGLMLAGEERDPRRTTTRGVGELILDAAGQGCTRVLLGLGGSCTNDCGIGMAAALGYRFADAAGKTVDPLAVNLGKIAAILPSPALPRLEVTAACDVDNPLLGKDGATYTFGPQKGADAACLAELEAGMSAFAAVLERQFARPVAAVPGAGAAGGLGAAVLTMLGGTLKSGIETLLDAARFDELLADADLVLTGEGRIDWQSAHGKVPMGVGLRCRRAGVPCLALCGSVGPGAEAVYDCGVTAVFSSLREPGSFAEIRHHSGENLALLTDSVLRTLAAFC